MARTKYSYAELSALLAQGMTNSAIAKKFGVHNTAISHAKAKMRKMSPMQIIARDQEVPDDKHPLIRKAVTAMGSEAFSALTRLDAQAQIVENENKFLLEQMKQYNPDTAEYSRNVECHNCHTMIPVLISDRTAVLNARMKLQDRLVKNAAEVRQQLETVKGVLKEAVKVAELEDFKRTVLEEIGHASPETQTRIIERLKQGRINTELNRFSKGGA